MFTRQNERPKALPGAGRFAGSLVDGRLWQRDEKKDEKKAGEKLTRRNPQPNEQLHAGALFTKSRAAGVSVRDGDIHGP